MLKHAGYTKHTCKKRSKKVYGFTLVELIISSVLVSIVALVITAFFLNNQEVIKTAMNRQKVHNQAYIAVKYLTRSIRNADSVDLINPSGGVSSEIELTELNTAGGEVDRYRYKLIENYYLIKGDAPLPDDVATCRSSADCSVVAEGVTGIAFSDGTGSAGTSELKLIDIEITVENEEGDISAEQASQAACRDRIYVLEYDWFDGTHNWRYNEADGTLICTDEGYDWTITLEETGVLSPEVMDYIGVDDQDVISLTFEGGVLTDMDGRPCIDGVVIIMKDDSVAIIPPEQTAIELHQSFSSYTFEATIAAKIGGYAPTISFGYYTYNDLGEKVLTEILPTSSAEAPITSDPFTPPVGEDFGFYMDVGSSGYTYYTETAENPDTFDHCWEYVSDALGTLVLGWEDLYGGGDEDHQDFVVTVKPIGVTP